MFLLLIKLCFEYKSVRLCGTDIPMSVGIVEPKTHPSQLNAAEFLWDMKKRTSVFVQVSHTSSLCAASCASCPPAGAYKTLLLNSATLAVTLHFAARLSSKVSFLQSCRLCWHPQVHCISTEFTPRKHGGEKGVPFRVQIDTFAQGDTGEYTEHLHSASCQIKVFKVHAFPFMSGGGGVFHPLLIRKLAVNPPLSSPLSQKGPIGSKRRTERRWRNAQSKRRKSTSLLMIPLSFQRSVWCNRVKQKP